MVRDFGAATGWRRDVKKVTVQKQSNGSVHFQEEGKNGTIKYELSDDLPGQRMVTRILKTDLGYSGKWTYVFAPENEGTRSTITEDGEVANPVFRFMSRYVFGQTATLDSYLTALSKSSVKTLSHNRSSPTMAKVYGRQRGYRASDRAWGWPDRV